MRKRVINNFFDNAMWYLLYLLPLFLLLICCFRTGQLMSLSEILETTGFSIFLDNPVYTCLNDIIGQNGVLPMFNVDVIIYLSYFCLMNLAHLLVDFLVFIPRVAHKWSEKFYCGGD